MIRHFTATGFVVSGESLLLHWHPRVGAWLPPGGHIEPNEDPVEAVLREVLEETGLVVEVVWDPPDPPSAHPVHIAPPVAIMVEDIDGPGEGHHQHIDMIYFCRPAGGPVGKLNPGWRWVHRRDIAAGIALGGHGGPPEPPPDDVRTLSEQAFQTVLGQPGGTQAGSSSPLSDPAQP